MTNALWVDQFLSVLLVNFCWWLAHENASSKLPLRKLMSLSYSILGMVLLSNMILRAFEELRSLLPWTLLFGKACLVVTFGLAAFRLTLTERNRK